ncbi:unnamed protein product [Ectocarpus sp. 8 AP-2014]
MRDPCMNSTVNAYALQARDMSKHFYRSSGLIHSTHAIDDDKCAHSLGLLVDLRTLRRRRSKPALRRAYDLPCTVKTCLVFSRYFPPGCSRTDSTQPSWLTAAGKCWVSKHTA